MIMKNYKIKTVLKAGAIALNLISSHLGLADTRTGTTEIDVTFENMLCQRSVLNLRTMTAHNLPWGYGWVSKEFISPSECLRSMATLLESYGEGTLLPFTEELLEERVVEYYCISSGKAEICRKWAKRTVTYNRGYLTIQMGEQQFRARKTLSGPFLH